MKTIAKSLMVVQKNSEAVLKSRLYGEILENIEQVNFATISEDKDGRILMTLCVDEGEYQLEICETSDRSSRSSNLPSITLADSEQYYGLTLLDKAVELFRSIGLNFSLEEETRSAIDLWESFRETTPKVDGNLRKILFPGNFLRILTMLGLAQKCEKDIVLL